MSSIPGHFIGKLNPRQGSYSVQWSILTFLLLLVYGAINGIWMQSLRNKILQTFEYNSLKNSSVSHF